MLPRWKGHDRDGTPTVTTGSAWWVFPVWMVLMIAATSVILNVARCGHRLDVPPPTGDTAAPE